MCTNEYQEIVNELIFMKNPYDGDDESYELSFINRKKELEEQINLLNTKYETDLEELEYIYFGYHSHYHQTINNLLEQLNDTNYIFNPGEKVYIESQILANKKNLNDQLIITKEKKIQLEKVYEDNVFSIRQEIFNLQIIYEQSLYYQIHKIDDLTISMKKLVT
jgi:hypothetical protein